eukprot:m.252797 g.252797  ORF g.252797 m.252797 type:complete len:321 (+) comp15922_c0_seq3:319-1281(+)
MRRRQPSSESPRRCVLLLQRLGNPEHRGLVATGPDDLEPEREPCAVVHPAGDADGREPRQARRDREHVVRKRLELRHCLSLCEGGGVSACRRGDQNVHRRLAAKDPAKVIADHPPDPLRLGVVRIVQGPREREGPGEHPLPDLAPERAVAGRGDHLFHRPALVRPPGPPAVLDPVVPRHVGRSLGEGEEIVRRERRRGVREAHCDHPAPAVLHPPLGLGPRPPPARRELLHQVLLRDPHRDPVERLANLWDVVGGGEAGGGVGGVRARHGVGHRGRGPDRRAQHPRGVKRRGVRREPVARRPAVRGLPAHHPAVGRREPD